VGLGGVGTRSAAKLASNLATATNPITFSLSAGAGFVQRAVADPTAGAIEAAAFLLSPFTAGLAPIALDLFGFGENLSAGDVERLTTRLAACQGQVRASGLPIALGSLSGKNLDVIEQGLRYALKQDRSARSIRTIRAGDALLRQAGYAGYTDPRIRDDGGIGGPNFRRLQKTVREGL
jgi:hypothetical protein